ncbi:hypothetical protein [Corynebacterium sp.]|uniref:hypothetical protein n=1 Tax=Corynebacterium sp. TaxID=1720 RepID=UPI0026DCCCE0|nr:hypothetical protein [Corynebacterium sp.]MDO5077874.1 hypothetical protein [Corynebacterium sp.]
MGRLLLLLLIVVAVVLVWKAFGPGTWRTPEEPAIKGPDDDEEFLWTLEKNRFKQRRAQELAREEEERIRKAKEKYHEEDEE